MTGLPGLPGLPGLLPTTNPVFSGGAALMVIGTAAASLRRIPSKAWTLTQSRLYCSVVLEDSDSLYPWMELWLADQPTTANAGRLRVISRFEYDPDEDADVIVPRLSAGDGDHVIRFNGAKFWFTQTSEGPSAGTMKLGRQRRLEIRCLKRERATLEQLLQAVSARQHDPEPDTVRIYLPEYDRWELHQRRKARNPESLILEDGVWEYIHGEARRFEESRAWYEQLNIPYRMGMLLEGTPGSGKSTAVFALAGALKRRLYVLPLGDSSMNDDKLVRLMSNIPQRAIVVAEDIDTAFEGRERTADNKLTLSGLLNSIDGPTATEGRILIMTTNRANVLDPALIRKGRCDLRVTFTNASVGQAERLFLRFFPGETERAAAFATWAGDGSHAMASLQAHLLERSSSADEAAKPELMTTQAAA